MVGTANVGDVGVGIPLPPNVPPVPLRGYVDEGDVAVCTNETPPADPAARLRPEGVSGVIALRL